MKKISDHDLKYYVYITVGLLYLTAFLTATPKQLVEGVWKIIVARDALITDYFQLAGVGAAFLNSALVTTVCIFLLLWQKIPFTGPTVAAIFMNIGYGFWGKNILNILPILLGTYLYALLHRVHFGRYIYTALFGICLAPFVTEMIYMMPFTPVFNFAFAILLGIFIGYVLPPLSAHTASMHMGYSLFNVGFSGGILAFVIVCVLRSFGLESEPVLLWQYGRPMWLIIGTYTYFALSFIWGFYISGRDIKKLFHIFRHPGRAVADFVLMDGAGATLMNMSLVGAVSLTYILLIGGDLCGPVLGAILIAFGYAAFGAHIKNYTPVLLGVFLFTLCSYYAPSTPGIQLAALFAVGLAPLAGQFGTIAGIISGMLHVAIVMYTSDMYGGLNLYNNGFSAGWVAIFMVPALESFMSRFKSRKKLSDKS